MIFIQIYAIALVVILGLMTILWLVSLGLKNSSIVDIFWGTGFVIAYWVYYALTPEGFPLRKLLLGALVTLWGLRLSIHILLRNWGKPEDFRYQKWRQEAGGRWWWLSFLRVFVLQVAPAMPPTPSDGLSVRVTRYTFAKRNSPCSDHYPLV